MTQNPRTRGDFARSRGESATSQTGFEVSRRNVDDEAANPTLPTGLQLGRYHFDMPVREELLARIELKETALNKGVEIQAHQRMVFSRREFRFRAHLLPLVALHVAGAHESGASPADRLRR